MTRDPALPPPKALLFDWDNTLVDTWEVIHAALEATFTAMGQTPWTLAETRVRVRQSAREAFPRLFGARAAEASEIFYRAFEDRHLDRLHARPGAEELLDALDRAGCFLGVVSNKQGYLLRREAAHLGWTGLLGSLVGANDAARDKPAADPVALALAPAGLVPGPEVWLVGDTDIDLLCAHNAGCVPVLLREQPPGALEFAEARPALYFPDCARLGASVLGDRSVAAGDTSSL